MCARDGGGATRGEGAVPVPAAPRGEARLRSCPTDTDAGCWEPTQGHKPAPRGPSLWSPFSQAGDVAGTQRAARGATTPGGWGIRGALTTPHSWQRRGWSGEQADVVSLKGLGAFWGLRAPGGLSRASPHEQAAPSSQVPARQLACAALPRVALVPCSHHVLGTLGQGQGWAPPHAPVTPTPTHIIDKY